MKLVFLIVCIIIIILFICSFSIEQFVLTNTCLHHKFNPHLYNGIDLIREDLNSEQHRRIQIGKQTASKSRIVIAGLAQNIQNQISLNIQRIEHLGKSFLDYKIVVFENDSEDSTRLILESNPKIDLLRCCDLGSCDCKIKSVPAVESKNLKDRITKMALFRNRILDHIKKNYQSWDYLLVLDLDAEGPFSTSGVFHSLSYKFDVIASNGLGAIPGSLGTVAMTYDAYAYVRDTSDHNLIYKYFDMNNTISKSKSDLIPVLSGFNGAALYKIESLKGSDYKGNSKCEHTNLHLNMVRNGYDKIFINRFWKWYVGIQGPRKFKNFYILFL